MRNVAFWPWQVCIRFPGVRLSTEHSTAIPAALCCGLQTMTKCYVLRPRTFMDIQVKQGAGRLGLRPLRYSRVMRKLLFLRLQGLALQTNTAQ